MLRFSLPIAKFIRELQFLSPWRHYFFPRYDYNFTPPQLLFLCECIEKTRQVSGGVAEVGCAGGKTAVFLKRFMEAQGIDKRYIAIDTFCGFVGSDVEHEVRKRGKPAREYKGFRLNSKRWFDGTMKLNKIENIDSIKADVNNFDFKKVAPLSFALLDVDLYLPTQNGLREIYNVLSPGGIIVADDCDRDTPKWDGAEQAYREFVKELGMPEQIIHKKLGIIQKPLIPA